MRGRIAPSEIDWDLLLLLSQHERATGVLWQQLRASDGFRPPERVSERFQRLASIARFHASHVEMRLQETLTSFAVVGVPVVLLKGAALATTAYGSWAERPMGDLDVLVAPRDISSAREAALAAGWAEAEEMYPAHRYEDHQHLPPLLDKSGTGLSLELHTELCIPGHSFGVSTSDLWREGRRLDDLPGAVHVPSPLHSALHLGVHFAWSHLMRFGTWRTIRDLSVLATLHPALWAKIGDAARERRVASCMYWTLRIARDAGGIEVPPSLLAELAPYRSELMASPLARHIELHVLPAEVPCPSDWLNQFLWRVAIRPRKSGHGLMRPKNTPLAESAVVTPDNLARKLLRQCRSAGLWSRYVYRVLFAGPTT